MKIITREVNLSTRGAGDFVNITGRVREELINSQLKDGNVTVFVVGSTAAVATFEYEPGLIADLKELYETIAPSSGKSYCHDATWGDANGFSHLRSALQGPSLTIPFSGAKLLTGTWQQVVFLEFDNRPRERMVILQFIGE